MLYSRKRYLMVAVFACCAAMAGIAISFALPSLAAHGSPRYVPGTALPATQLPGSSGFQRIHGMSEIISGRVPLWIEKDGRGPYSENAIGFTGSLQQGFVPQPAIQQYGNLGKGLTLPLPQSFAANHPGPAEVFDMIWAFTNTAAPGKLLHDPAFTDAGAPGTTALRIGSIHGGLVWRITSQANGGMKEFKFEWTRGIHLIEVSVVGDRLSLTQARDVAAQAGR